MLLFLLDYDIYRHPCRWFDGVDVSKLVMIDIVFESNERERVVLHFAHGSVASMRLPDSVLAQGLGILW
jgi:hypothetical protein